MNEEGKLTCSICSTAHNSEANRGLCIQSHSELITLRWMAYELSSRREELEGKIKDIDYDLLEQSRLILL